MESHGETLSGTGVAAGSRRFLLQSKITPAAEKALISVVLSAIIVPLFIATGELPANHAPASWLITRWDSIIPVMPIAVWPYISWYLAPVPLLAATRRNFRLAACAIALAFVVCTIGYVVFPASMQRPAIAGSTLSERVLLLLYGIDPPWNIFPSFHAALCAVLWRPLFGGGVARKIMPLWMATICASCVLTKQHNLIDIVVGLVVGFLSLAVVTAAFHRLEKTALIVAQPADAEAILP
jgi:membrane-associated phospholipid phosphatase